MLRTLLLVLLLVNGLLLAAYSGLFEAGSDGEREPERLQRQHQPALVKVLDPQAASAARAAASTALAASAAQAAAACVEAGPFPPAEAAAAERGLRDLGLAPGSWQALRHEEGGAWLVYMGRYADREVLQRKLSELRRLKLDGEEVQNAPELQPGISLGRFEDVDSARAALAQLARRGVRTARVIVLRAPQAMTVLRLPAADGALRSRLATLQLPAGAGFVACAATSAAGPASAASGTPAASAPAAAPASAPAASAPAAAPVASAAAPAARATPAAAAATAAPAPAARASVPPAAPASQARVAGADTRAALQRAASVAAAEAAAAKAALAGSAPASR
jgi:hypothetical protein